MRKFANLLAIFLNEFTNSMSMIPSFFCNKNFLNIIKNPILQLFNIYFEYLRFDMTDAGYSEFKI